MIQSMFLKKCGPGQAGLLPVGHARGQLSLDHAHGGRSPLKAVNPCMISIQRRCVDSSGAQIEDETIRTPQTRRLVMIGELLADDEFLSLFQSHCDDVLSRPSIQNSLSPVMVKEEAIGPDLKLDSPEPIPTVVPAVPGDRSPSPPQYYLPIVDEIVEEVIEPASSAPTLPPSFDDGFTRVSRRKPKRSSRPQRIVREHQTVLAEHVVPPSAPPLLPPTQPAHPRTTSLADKRASMVSRLQCSGIVGAAGPEGVLRAEVIRTSAHTAAYVLRFLPPHSWIKLHGLLSCPDSALSTGDAVHVRIDSLWEESGVWKLLCSLASPPTSSTRPPSLEEAGPGVDVDAHPSSDSSSLSCDGPAQDACSSSDAGSLEAVEGLHTSLPSSCPPSLPQHSQPHAIPRTSDDPTGPATRNCAHSVTQQDAEEKGEEKKCGETEEENVGEGTEEGEAEEEEEEDGAEMEGEEEEDMEEDEAECDAYESVAVDGSGLGSPFIDPAAYSSFYGYMPVYPVYPGPYEDLGSPDGGYPPYYPPFLPSPATTSTPNGYYVHESHGSCYWKPAAPKLDPNAKEFVPVTTSGEK